MVCPAPCRQAIHGANKIKVHGTWRHKRCPATVKQAQEIQAAKSEATRIAKKIKWTKAIEVEPTRPSEWRRILKDVMARALSLKPKSKRKKK